MSKRMASEMGACETGGCEFFGAEQAPTYKYTKTTHQEVASRSTANNLNPFEIARNAQRTAALEAQLQQEAQCRAQAELENQQLRDALHKQTSQLQAALQFLIKKLQQQEARHQEERQETLARRYEDYYSYS